MKHLTVYCDQANFFRRLERGAVFTYSEAFDFDMVCELAFRQGRMISYCPPGTVEYRQYGSMTCQVTWVKPDRPLAESFRSVQC